MVVLVLKKKEKKNPERSVIKSYIHTMDEGKYVINLSYIDYYYSYRQVPR